MWNPLPPPFCGSFKKRAIVTTSRLRPLEELDDRFQVVERRHLMTPIVPHHFGRREARGERLALLGLARSVRPTQAVQRGQRE